MLVQVGQAGMDVLLGRVLQNGLLGQGTASPSQLIVDLGLVHGLLVPVRCIQILLGQLQIAGQTLSCHPSLQPVPCLVVGSAQSAEQEIGQVGEL